MPRIPIKRAAVACAVAAALAVVPAAVVPRTANAWSNLESRWRTSYFPFSAFDSNGLVVADGRVWWLEDQYTEYQAKGFRLASQPLRGGSVRRTMLAADSMSSPVINGRPFDFPSATYFRMRDGQAVVYGSWYARVEDPNDVNPSGGQFLASFDAVSGVLKRQDDPRASAGGGDPRPVDGDPAVMGTPANSVPQVLSDPTTGSEFAIRLGFSQSPEVAGPYLLSFPTSLSSRLSSAETWARGGGKLRVRDLATGHVQYTLSARQLTRAAGLPASNGGTWVSLMDDGSLKVGVNPRGRAARPVAVDPRGRIRRIGGSIRGAEEIQAVIGHGRAFVYVAKPRGKRDLYERLWITDTAGKRGRALKVSDRNGSARVLPFFWDGRYAVWTTEEPRRDDLGTWVEHNVPRSRLRSSDVPARWRP